ncbi:Dimethyladenosine transferase [Ceratobasidium sp. 428]|nr:Dimethyladenosine transferase [Ceratobasidium sp. 428]
MELLERNFRTWCAEKQQTIPDEFNIKKEVESILQNTGFRENRAAKMDIDDLLKLLSAFHEKGIHFA